jgi:hypothetical protein
MPIPIKSVPAFTVSSLNRPFAFCLTYQITVFKSHTNQHTR